MVAMAAPTVIEPGETPESFKRRQLIAQALMAKGMSDEPIQHWTQGAARMAQAAIGGGLGWKAEQDQKDAQRQALTDALGALGGGGTTQAAPQAQQASAGNVEAPQRIAQAFDAAGGVSARNIGSGGGDLNAAIQQAAQARGVDPAYLTRLAQIESGGRTNAANPNSSAKGAFQFINSTAKQYGLQNPNDPAQSADAAARFTLDNKAALVKALGREPSPGELYLAHQQGAGGASKLLSNPSASAAALVGQDAIRLNGGRPDMTAGDFASKWTNKFGGTQVAQAGGGMPAPQPSREAMIRALSNPNLNPTIAAVLAQKLTADDKASFGVIGKDEFGNERYGWIDASKRTTTDSQPGGQRTAGGGISGMPSAPPGVDPKEWRKQATERAFDANAPAKSDDVTGLRKEMQQLPSYKNVSQAAPVYRSMVQAAGRDTRAADVNLIYGLAKIMDPTSVVRESEMTIAQAIATLPQHIQATVKSQIESTGRLSGDVRQGIMEEAHSRMNAFAEGYATDQQMFRGIAARRRMNPDDVIQDFGKFNPYKAAPKPDGAGLQPGESITRPGGITIKRVQ
jgi:hypothetical protein